MARAVEIPIEVIDRFSGGFNKVNTALDQTLKSSQKLSTDGAKNADFLSKAWKGWTDLAITSSRQVQHAFLAFLGPISAIIFIVQTATRAWEAFNKTTSETLNVLGDIQKSLNTSEAIFKRLNESRTVETLGEAIRDAEQALEGMSTAQEKAFEQSAKGVGLWESLKISIFGASSETKVFQNKTADVDLQIQRLNASLASAKNRLVELKVIQKESTQASQELATQSRTTAMFIASSFSKVFSTLIMDAKNMHDVLKGIFRSLSQSLIEFGAQQAIMGAMRGFSMGPAGIIATGIGLLGAGRFLGLKHGGIIMAQNGLIVGPNNPTMIGSNIMAGEGSEPEIVSPLSRLSSLVRESGLGEVSVNFGDININVNGDVGSSSGRSALLAALADELKNATREAIFFARRSADLSSRNSLRAV